MLLHYKDFITEVTRSDLFLNMTTLSINISGVNESSNLFSATSCESGLCKNIIDVSLLNLTTVNVTVMAANPFGNGSTHQVVIGMYTHNSRKLINVLKQ